MSEKPTQFERPPVKVIGKAPEEEKEKYSKEIAERFREGIIKEFPETFIQKINTLEYDKKSYEIDFITASNRILNTILERSGIEPFDISAKNIHIIPPEVFKEGGYGSDNFTAVQDTKRQLIALNASYARKTPFRAAGDILHEMTHLKGFVSFDIAEKKPVKETSKENEYEKNARRVGYVTYGSYKKAKQDNYYENFRGLNEAVVSHIENRYVEQIMASSDDPEIKEELEWLKSEKAEELKKKVAKEKDINSAYDISWIDQTGENYFLRSYPGQRKVLYYIAEVIAEDTDKTKEGILDLFIKNHFTGNLLEIARLVESAFGKNSFRILGDMTGEKQSANKIFNILKKMRKDHKETYRGEKD